LRQFTGTVVAARARAECSGNTPDLPVAIDTADAVGALIGNVDLAVGGEGDVRVGAQASADRGPGIAVVARDARSAYRREDRKSVV
jgi:hypothetical protein